MFDGLSLFGMTLEEIMILIILGFIALMNGIFIISLIRNRNKVRFYSLIVRENGRISKVGISFIFIMLLIAYQVVSEKEISGYLAELLGFIFAAELGKQYVDSKTITQTQMSNIKDSLSNVNMSEKSQSARDVSKINFDSL